MKERVETWRRVESKTIADCRVFKVREDSCERASDGAKASFFVTENPDWVNVIALTKEKEVVLIEQFRHGTEEIILEIPGGMVDDGEDAKDTARRELLEETGYSSNEFVYLGKSRPNPAISNNWIYHYLAIDCEKTDEIAFDEHESVVTKLVPLAEIENLVKNGEITHSLAIVGFYYLNLSEVKRSF